MVTFIRIAFAAVLALTPILVLAQAYPSRPVKIIVPFPPGGGTDIGTHAINISLYKKLPYDPVRDFAPINQVAGLPLFVLVHPSGTAPAIINKISADVVRIINLPDVKERLLAQGAEPIGSRPEQFAAVLANDIAKYAKVIKASGVPLE